MSESAVAEGPVGGPVEGPVPNAYKRAVRRARGEGEHAAEALVRLLDGAVSALEAGAWISTGPAAEHFGAGLLDQRRTLLRVVDGVGDEFLETLHREPDQVPPDSWRARWSG